MNIRHAHTAAGKSRTPQHDVLPSLSTNLITGDIDVAFIERESGRRTTLRMSSSEARALATSLTEAVAAADHVQAAADSFQSATRDHGAE